jgi:ADP-heptose:LPS heptosyltransferase
MHIAAALNKPLISIWGCTRPSLGLSPWRPHRATITLLPQDRDSRPCSRHGAKCRFKSRGQDLCIHHVSPSRIIDAATHILNPDHLHK